METRLKKVSTLTIGEWTRIFSRLQNIGAQDGEHAAQMISRLNDSQYEYLMDLGTDWTGLYQIQACIDTPAFLATYTLWRKA